MSLVNFVFIIIISWAVKYIKKLVFRLMCEFGVGSKWMRGSSIAHNCTISDKNAGVFIGKNVMIAPNVVIVAFNLGVEKLGILMPNQKHVEAPIIIEDDVWIGVNCTIGMGIRIEKGAIIGANSYVNKIY